MTNLPVGGNLRGAIDLSSLVKPPARPAGATPAPGTPSLVVEATDASFSSILELSNTVPVLVEFYGPGLEPVLGPLVTSYSGRLVLATIDGGRNPQLVQAFQVTEVPAVAAVIGGRPLQLFVGLPAEEEVRRVIDQMLEVAAQQGVKGTINAGAEGEPAEPVEEPLPPHHQEAYDAIAAGDFDLAIKEYELAIVQDPRDHLAVAGLAQVRLLSRLDGQTADAVRSAAAAAPDDVTAQLAVADLDVSGGHLDDAFSRLLDLFPTLDAEGKNNVRARLLDFFEIAGADDPRVATARRRLTGLLY
ncbi:tetratricopeptide repeat protein [Glaciihabitans arcticus]|uniref:Tetratricopeptide repeat protein n=1 Tax=Glaciihabitans arcticus TaxID=2668039 RepID=A0A4Q9GQF6_9MICO|nr:tetratricopeptide repeat protein [Glaciihabitans arcticus]TBN56214.1 tetratricopeptide repeat protein [Glaciihabitans arcticus]